MPLTPGNPNDPEPAPRPRPLPVLYGEGFPDELEAEDRYIPYIPALADPEFDALPPDTVWSEVEDRKTIGEEVHVWHPGEDEPVSFLTGDKILICCYDPNEVEERQRFEKAATLAAEKDAAMRATLAPIIANFDEHTIDAPVVDRVDMFTGFLVRRQALGMLTAPSNDELTADFLDQLVSASAKARADRQLNMARHLLNADIGTTIDTPDGPLILVSAPSPDEYATLTADGGEAIIARCLCVATPETQGIRFEQRNVHGLRAGHGYVCPNCRCLTENG